MNQQGGIPPNQMTQGNGMNPNMTNQMGIRNPMNPNQQQQQQQVGQNTMNQPNRPMNPNFQQAANNMGGMPNNRFPQAAGPPMNVRKSFFMLRADLYIILVFSK